MTIKLKGIIWEDMVNYRKISTTLMFPYCNFKCDIEAGTAVCQNSVLATSPLTEIDIDDFMTTYMKTFLSDAIVLQGLEPLDSIKDIYTIANALRDWKINSDLVIYTGYKKSEVDMLTLHNIANIIPGTLIVKFGRYIPNQTPHYDKVLGVKLSSDNQYAEVIEKNAN